MIVNRHLQALDSVIDNKCNNSLAANADLFAV